MSICDVYTHHKTFLLFLYDPHYIPPSQEKCEIKYRAIFKRLTNPRVRDLKISRKYDDKIHGGYVLLFTTGSFKERL